MKIHNHETEFQNKLLIYFFSKSMENRTMMLQWSLMYFPDLFNNWPIIWKLSRCVVTNTIQIVDSFLFTKYPKTQNNWEALKKYGIWICQILKVFWIFQLEKIIFCQNAYFCLNRIFKPHYFYFFSYFVRRVGGF